MRVAVTGATGFIGAALTPLLDRHDLLLLERATTDLNDPVSWMPAAKAFAPQACVHLAWDGLPDYSAERCAQNLAMSTRLLGGLAELGVKRFVVAGSCWEYGDRSGGVSEDVAPLNPGLFAQTKLSVLRALADIPGIDWRWGRVFFSYGAAQRPASLIPAARAAALNGETLSLKTPGTLQDFIHIDDVATALRSLLESDVVSGVYNIGSGEPATVHSVARRVAAHYGVSMPEQSAGEASGFWADRSKLSAATGWAPLVTLQAGVEQVLRELDGR